MPALHLETMKRFTFHISILLMAILFISISSCKKESFITSQDALLRTSVDTLHYDTVFTSVGSITQSFKIFNMNDQKLRLSNVQLMGGSTSFFKINVDGVAGTSFSDIEINANDSIYVFATVNINPNASNLPFIVQDSIRINYNGNTTYVQLDAFGQNANFFRNKRVTTDSTWKNNLPFVILGSLTVDSAKTLTINKGTKVYFHADAPMLINGTLKAIGANNDIDRIKFAGDRLDEPYKDFPGSWPGIYFNSSSKDNLMQYCIVKNAYQGTIVINPPPLPNTNTKLVLQECIIDNIYDVAIGGSNTTISARNCLVSNCGYNVYVTGGGVYDFNYCTLASYGNNYLPHKYPVLTISDVATATLNRPVTFTMKNSIVYGEGGLPEDEIAFIKKGTQFNTTFDNVLYRMKNTVPTTTALFTNSLPYSSKVQVLFDSIDAGNRYFNFRLSSASPCIDKGITIPGISFDLDGNNRIAGTPPKSDLGCYEKQ
jgi:hypothetical protein